MLFTKEADPATPEMGPLYAIGKWLGGMHWKLLGYENGYIFIDSEEDADLLLTPSMVSKGDAPVYDIWKKAVMEVYDRLHITDNVLYEVLDSDFTKFDGDVFQFRRSVKEGKEVE